jgi:ring-1,2-phenylacetyl-CoA epoxidase subunit PaaD
MVDRLATARAVAGSVPDPELPVVTVAELGILRGVAIRQDGRVEVEITPTYIGCPAMTVIRLEIEQALVRAGFRDVMVRTVLSPAWSSDWLSEAARRKLREAGIAPPSPGPAACPRCGSTDTETISEFGATACKALCRCRACREPFEAFKRH